MIVDETNYPIADDAIRDILFMYRDMIDSYHGFGATIDVGSFDAMAFLNCSVAEPLQPQTEEQLLQEGSAVCLLQRLYDTWAKSSGETLPATAFVSEVREALAQGRFDHLALARAALEAGFQSEEAFWARLPKVYDAYVVGYFKRLLS